MYGIAISSEHLTKRHDPLGFLKYVTAAAIRSRVLIHPLVVGVIPVFPALNASEGELQTMIDRVEAVIATL